MSEYITNGESALAVRQKINSGLLVPAEATENSSAIEVTAPEGTSYIYFTAPSNYSNKTLKINGTPFAIRSQYNIAPVTGWRVGAIVRMFLNNESNIAYIEDVPCYTKQETLTSEVADLFNNATTPNDAFSFLGEYTQWRWKRRTTVFSEKLGADEYVAYDPSSSSTQYSAQYSDTINIDQTTGKISIVSPKTVKFTWFTANEVLEPLKGKYIIPQDKSSIFYAGVNYEIYTMNTSGDLDLTILGIQPVSSQPGYGKWEEVRASTSNAYPNSGIQDGYEYVALGMPLENAKNRIPVIGSYTGTGVYGEENKNHISLPGRPLCIWIFANKESSRMFISCESDSGTAVFSSATDDYFNNVYSFDNNGNDLYWYCNYGGSAGGGTGSNASAYGQLNSSGVKYNYIAFYGGV